MNEAVRGVALIIVNPKGEVLILQEFESKPHFGKYPGMFSIPMETSDPGEPDDSTLRRLIVEELPGCQSYKINLMEKRAGIYQIVNNVWVSLYVGRVKNSFPTTQSDKTTEVGNHEWVAPRKALTLWLRQGASEMLSDYIHDRSEVIRENCSSPPPP